MKYRDFNVGDKVLVKMHNKDAWKVGKIENKVILYGIGKWTKYAQCWYDTFVTLDQAAIIGMLGANQAWRKTCRLSTSPTNSQSWVMNKL